MSQVSQQIEIQVNGRISRIPAGSTVAGLLRSMDIKADRVAVEMNRQLVRRDDWENSAIPDGASVEIVTFVGGG
jgi:thiamine biosynthesis protein ThiS